MTDLTTSGDLTEAALEQAIRDIASFKDDSGELLSIQPTAMVVNPQILSELGMTIDDLRDYERELRSQLK